MVKRSSVVSALPGSQTHVVADSGHELFPLCSFGSGGVPGRDLARSIISRVIKSPAANFEGNMTIAALNDLRYVF